MSAQDWGNSSYTNIMNITIMYTAPFSNTCTEYTWAFVLSNFCCALVIAMLMFTHTRVHTDTRTDGGGNKPQI